MRKSGYVTLVGAGPGDPGLITIKGKAALEKADVVLYDRLVGEEILKMIPAHAEMVDVGKKPGHHLVPQQQINNTILQYAREGKRVVRLKGGDPYLFGRGAEELEAVIKEKIPFQVVPGVTSAVSVPAYAGIPVTHREHTSSLHIITGHAKQGAEPQIPYESLVKLGGTLVFLMGVGAIGEITGGLVAAGMAGDTPAALIENGTRPTQRQITAPLSEIAANAKAEAFCPPSVLVVGAVCALALDLNWHAKLPLFGAKVLVTRPKAAANSLTALLREKGCNVLELPCIRTKELPAASASLQNAGGCDWIVFTSPVGVELFFKQLHGQGLDARFLHRAKFAAIGPRTAAALREQGIFADYMPQNYSGEALLNGLLPQLGTGQRVLLFRAAAGDPRLCEELKHHGMLVEDVAAYETIYEAPACEEAEQALLSGEVDYVTFTSASTVHGFVKACGKINPQRLTGVCIGAQTAAAAEQYGFRVIVSSHATVESMVLSMEADYTGAKKA